MSVGWGERARKFREKKVGWVWNMYQTQNCILHRHLANRHCIANLGTTLYLALANLALHWHWHTQTLALHWHWHTQSNSYESKTWVRNGVGQDFIDRQNTWDRDREKTLSQRARLVIEPCTPQAWTSLSLGRWQWMTGMTSSSSAGGGCTDVKVVESLTGGSRGRGAAPRGCS